ncbi:PKD domain-containing protein [Pelagicoccus sp. SDUM812005]|uniref:PKD domain-containing protein n=1 Tax=Pelagicoccus sp. SDUM812005 TaxID=3041257 RepID=UPI00280C4E07|nr:PKD domain-containing protein [Pelagicoccus sp. SDUM812005]MDQ8181678.1 PKD domain-containing protein [Pelagicoccus sp. SDUM812005]
MRPLALVSAVLCIPWALPALERADKVFQIYQFGADEIPRIDGDATDWSQVPSSYAVGTEELWEDSGKHEGTLPESLDVSVKVAWVKGLNRLYFLYEAYDDYWDFSLPGLKNDTFEVVVDADLSGGPLIDRFRNNAERLEVADAWLSMHGAHAQNYHIFTPARDKDWCMLWGPAQWIKELPYSNYAYRYDFEPGQSGKLTLEFWITPFDFASPEGPENSVESKLQEGKLIGLSWAIIDYDNVDSDRNNGFWNLSRAHTMYGKANELVAFRLMPRESERLPEFQAAWSCRIVDRKSRMVAFFDESFGEIQSWRWDFGDGNSSTEANPIHRYAETGHYVVTLSVTNEAGERSQFSRVWDVSFK